MIWKSFDRINKITLHSKSTKIEYFYVMIFLEVHYKCEYHHDYLLKNNLFLKLLKWWMLALKNVMNKNMIKFDRNRSLLETSNRSKERELQRQLLWLVYSERSKPDVDCQKKLIEKFVKHYVIGSWELKNEKLIWLHE